MKTLYLVRTVCVYAINMRSWLKEQTQTNRDQAQRQESVSVADGPRMSPAIQHRAENRGA
jgi:hypothetical protein